MGKIIIIIGIICSLGLFWFGGTLAGVPCLIQCYNGTCFALETIIIWILAVIILICAFSFGLGVDYDSNKL